MSTRSDEATRSIPLPLTTLLLQSTPEHPLTRVVSRSVLPRVAAVEGLVQNSALRRLGLGHAATSCIACTAFGGLVWRHRAQWRAMIGVLGVAEAVCNSLKLLSRLDDQDRTEEEDAEDQKPASDTIRQQVKHVVSFWVVFALVAIGESVRANANVGQPGKPSLVWTKLRPVARHLRVALWRLANRYPRFEFFVPARPKPLKRPFPQPRPATAVAVPFQPAVTAWLSSEVRYRLAKLVFLWTMLMRDGLGASALWDWVLGPLFTVQKGRIGKGDKSARRRVARVVFDEVDTGATSASPAQDSFGGADESPSTSTSPAPSRHSYSPSRDNAHKDYSFSSMASPTTSGASVGGGGSPYTTAANSNPSFPTPNVPFRLTSSSHPIKGLLSDYERATISFPTRTDSPTPTGGRMHDFAVSELGASMDGDKSWIGAKEWAA